MPFSGDCFFCSELNTSVEYFREYAAFTLDPNDAWNANPPSNNQQFIKVDPNMGIWWPQAAIKIYRTRLLGRVYLQNMDQDNQFMVPWLLNYDSQIKKILDVSRSTYRAFRYTTLSRLSALLLTIHFSIFRWWSSRFPRFPSNLFFLLVKSSLNPQLSLLLIKPP